MKLRSEKQRATAGLAGVFLTFWLTLFSLHCTAAATPVGSLPAPSDNQEVFLGGVHAGTPHHECHGNCKSAYIRAEAAESKQLLTAFSPQAPALPVASEDCSQPEAREESRRVIPSPDRAVQHPLALNCVQLK